MLHDCNYLSSDAGNRARKHLGNGVSDRFGHIVMGVMFENIIEAMFEIVAVII